jgi:hypothetical protein
MLCGYALPFRHTPQATPTRLRLPARLVTRAALCSLQVSRCHSRCSVISTARRCSRVTHHLCGMRNLEMLVEWDVTDQKAPSLHQLYIVLGMLLSLMVCTHISIHTSSGNVSPPGKDSIQRHVSRSQASHTNAHLAQNVEGDSRQDPGMSHRNVLAPLDPALRRCVQTRIPSSLDNCAIAYLRE